MGKRERLIRVDLRCDKCDSIQPIQRRQGKMYSSKGGHKKKMWCFKCKLEVNHTELADYCRSGR
jgi:hypothetical protein